MFFGVGGVPVPYKNSFFGVPRERVVPGPPKMVLCGFLGAPYPQNKCLGVGGGGSRTPQSVFSGYGVEGGSRPPKKSLWATAEGSSRILKKHFFRDMGRSRTLKK